MNKIALFLIIMSTVVFTTACTKHCSIEGCENEIYKEGLCKKHYYINQGADAVEDVVNGIMDIIK